MHHTLVSSDPDIKSEPLEFQATVFTQPWCPYLKDNKIGRHQH